MDGGRWQQEALMGNLADHQTWAQAVNSLSLLGYKWPEGDNGWKGTAAQSCKRTNKIRKVLMPHVQQCKHTPQPEQLESVLDFPQGEQIWRDEGSRERECDSLVYLKCYLLSSKPIL